MRTCARTVFNETLLNQLSSSGGGERGDFILRLNDVRFRKGGKPLGFLNPMLYSNATAKALVDIPNGANGAAINTPINPW